MSDRSRNILKKEEGMRKVEKAFYIGGPWFFGIVLIISALVVGRNPDTIIPELMLFCSGLVCTSIYCVCALMYRLIEENKAR
jgi:hypothetical protein